MARSTARKKSAAEPYLKSKNALYLWSFIGVNIAVFLCLLITNGLTEASLDHVWQEVAAKTGIFGAGIPILAIVLAGVLDDTAKARLVFWRWANPLPGCRVFSKLLGADPRINVPALQSKLGDFPTDARAQNALWFDVYKRHRGKLRVLEAHKVYLLTRDMAAISAIFVVLFSVIVLMGPVDRKVAGFYALALVVQYVLVATAARSYGNRFVLNALCEELDA